MSCNGEISAPYAEHRWIEVGSNWVCGDCDRSC